MSKKCKTCKHVIAQEAPRYTCVSCNRSMHLEPTCTGLSQVAINEIKELDPFSMLFCNALLDNDERDSFVSCRTIEKMMETSRQDYLEVNFWLQGMEERLTTVVLEKVDNAVKTTCYKVEKFLCRFHKRHCQSG